MHYQKRTDKLTTYKTPWTQSSTVFHVSIIRIVSQSLLALPLT